MSFIVDILTPSNVIAKGLKAKSVLVPTTTGEINLLPMHTHMISKLDTGIMTVYTEDGEKKFLITSGILKVLGDEVKVLVNVGENEKDIDIDRAMKAKAKALEKLNNESLTDLEYIKYTRKRERADARIRLGYLRDGKGFRGDVHSPIYPDRE